MKVDEKGLVRLPGLSDALPVLLGKNQAIGLLYPGGAVEGLEHGPWVGGCGGGGGGGLLGWVFLCERPLRNRAKPKGDVSSGL